MENLPFTSPHSVLRLRWHKPTDWKYSISELLLKEINAFPISKTSLLRTWAGSLMHGGDRSDRFINFPPSITQEFKLAQQMADRHGYGSCGCYVVCTTTLGHFSPCSSAGVKTCSEYSTNVRTFPTIAPGMCLNLGCKVCLGDWRGVKRFLRTRGWTCAACFSYSWHFIL